MQKTDRYLWWLLCQKPLKSNIAIVLDNLNNSKNNDIINN